MLSLVVGVLVGLATGSFLALLLGGEERQIGGRNVDALILGLTAVAAFGLSAFLTYVFV